MPRIANKYRTPGGPLSGCGMLARFMYTMQDMYVIDILINIISKVGTGGSRPLSILTVAFMHVPQNCDAIMRSNPILLLYISKTAIHKTLALRRHNNPCSSCGNVDVNPAVDGVRAIG